MIVRDVARVPDRFGIDYLSEGHEEVGFGVPDRGENETLLKGGRVIKKRD